MDRYLDEYIETLSGGNLSTIYQVLRENTLGQRNLQNLVQRASNQTLSVSQPPSKVTRGSLVDGNVLFNYFSRALVECNALEGFCDNVSTIFYSTKDLHESTLDDIRKQLVSLEKLIKNFAFLYSGDPGFNYSWGDSFDDESRIESGETIIFKDRDGRTIDEPASINAAEGTLTLGDKAGDNITPTKIKLYLSNATQALEQKYPVGKDLSFQADFWSQERINNPLEGTTDTGAQVILRYVLDTPCSTNCVILSNRSAYPVEILRIWVYGEDKSLTLEYTPEEAIKVLGKTAVYIPTSSAREIRILFLQKQYRIEHYAGKNAPTDDEGKKNMIEPWYSWPADAPEWMYIKEDEFGSDIATPDDDKASFYESIVRESFTNAGINTAVKNLRGQRGEGLYYHYTFYLEPPEFRLDVSATGRGIYISKPITASKTIREISLQSEEAHPQDYTDNRQSPRSTSVEYFLSIDNGGSWMPIRPSNLSYVYGERIIPDSLGYARTLFSFQDPVASKDVEITVYRNGKILKRGESSEGGYWMVQTDAHGNGVGIQLMALAFSPKDKYTVDYTPAESPVIDISGMSPLAGAGNNVRLAVVLRNNAERPTSPTLYFIQIKGKVKEE